MKSQDYKNKRKPKQNSRLSAKDLEELPPGGTLFIIVNDFHQLKCFRQIVYYVSGTSDLRFETREKQLHNEDEKSLLEIKRIV